MARSLPKLLFVVAALVVPFAKCQMEQFERKPRPFNKDLPYLKCPVCKMAMEEVWKLVAEARASDGGGTRAVGKVSEDEYQDIAGSVCNPEIDEGEWMLMVDITQAKKGSSLKLERQEHLGECRRECRTVEKACGAVFDEYREDLAEALYLRKPDDLEKLTSRVCTKWAQVCPAKSVPKSYERVDEYWVPMDEDSYKIRQMEKTVNAMTQKHKTQPVKFVDPMGGMFMGSDGWDEEEEGWQDPMQAMMESMGAMYGGGDEGDEGPAAEDFGGEL